MADSLALHAARWAVNMDNCPERARLINGHRNLRVTREVGGLPVTDHTVADEWLIQEWKRSADPELIAHLEQDRNERVRAHRERRAAMRRNA